MVLWERFGPTGDSDLQGFGIEVDQPLKLLEKPLHELIVREFERAVVIDMTGRDSDELYWPFTKV